MGNCELKIVTAVVHFGSRERIFQGISREDVRLKVEGYLKRCDYDGDSEQWICRNCRYCICFGNGKKAI